MMSNGMCKLIHISYDLFNVYLLKSCKQKKNSSMMMQLDLAFPQCERKPQ